MIPSPEEIEAAKTPAGAWTKATLAAWGVSWPPPKGWRKDLERAYWRWPERMARAFAKWGISWPVPPDWVEQVQGQADGAVLDTPHWEPIPDLPPCRWCGNRLFLNRMKQFNDETNIRVFGCDGSLADDDEAVDYIECLVCESMVPEVVWRGEWPHALAARTLMLADLYKPAPP